MLDQAGRWILDQADYRIVALVTLLVVLAFVGIRRRRYSKWPSVRESMEVAFNTLAIFSAIAVGVVFLFYQAACDGGLVA